MIGMIEMIEMIGMMGDAQDTHCSLSPSAKETPGDAGENYVRPALLIG